MWCKIRINKIRIYVQVIFLSLVEVTSLIIKAKLNKKIFDYLSFSSS